VLHPAGAPRRHAHPADIPRRTRCTSHDTDRLDEIGHLLAEQHANPSVPTSTPLPAKKTEEIPNAGAA
jgi:hypothetical protein